MSELMVLIVTCRSRVTAPGRKQPVPCRENASRSLGVFSRAPSAVANRQRWTAVLEDRGEGSVPAQGHWGLRGSQPGTEGVL